jgi:hypothetical protein
LLRDGKKILFYPKASTASGKYTRLTARGNSSDGARRVTFYGQNLNRNNMKWIRVAVLLDFLHCSYERYVLVTGYFSFLRYKGGEDTPTHLRLLIIRGHTNYLSLGEE